MDAFNWLHLTDLHWGLKGQKHLWPTIRQMFFESLEEVYQKTKPWHAVLFTGDFVQKGTKAEFDDLENEVLGPLWEHFDQLGCNPPLLAVPGNHDLQRPLGEAFQALEAAVDPMTKPGGFGSVAEKFWASETSQYRQLVNQVFADYRNWQTSRPHCPPTQVGTVVKSPEPIEHLTARALGNHHQAAQREWDERWSGVIGDDNGQDAGE